MYYKATTEPIEYYDGVESDAEFLCGKYGHNIPINAIVRTATFRVIDPEEARKRISALWGYLWSEH